MTNSPDKLLIITPRQADRLARAVTMYLEMPNLLRVKEMIAARAAIDEPLEVQ